MAERKAAREAKRQLGQFMTPLALAAAIVDGLVLTPEARILEPAFGDGAFLVALIERLMRVGPEAPADRFARIMTRQLFGVEIDEELAEEAVKRIVERWGPLPAQHNLLTADFFRAEFINESFDLVVGNPPFGGTFDPAIEDQLDRRYGRWDGHKLKKETYSFFIARSLELIRPEGTLCFISSDTFTTISTMGGLRRRLMDETSASIKHLDSFSGETTQPSLVLTASKTGRSTELHVDGAVVPRDEIALTGNFSWKIDSEMARYFRGPVLADYIVATGGMTIGRNELFVRDLGEDGRFTEPFSFEFFDDPITLDKELAKARLGRLSPRLRSRIEEQERRGAVQRNVRVIERKAPLTLDFPHPDYRPYNKANKGIVYAPPRHVIFWRDEGDAVLTFKRNGNWYLHGVGGQPYFGREGLSWHLVSSSIRMRYLPAGCILDSGAPCAFLRPGVARDELWFILGWCLTKEATRIMKTVLNHTRNIQSKDVERLPYPWWVAEAAKAAIIDAVQRLVRSALEGAEFGADAPEVRALDAMFAFVAQEGRVAECVPASRTGMDPDSLLAA